MSISIRSVGLAVLGTMLVAVTAATAEAASSEQFEIVNLHESASVVQAWFAPNGREDLPWKAISMHSPVRPRSTSGFTITDPTTCSFDFKVRFSDGYVQTIGNVNVCTKPYVVVS